jgi:tryptophanyl-tRNA synthetase
VRLSVGVMQVKKYAFSGGQATVEEHRAKGANLETDVAYQYLTFFLEDDDELREVSTQYAPVMPDVSVF